ncbi:hypothetical protein FEM03_14350 [Phragmitibacter flavus]|uniref:Cytochrome c domain-containing protein n=1 Tax=Phragmitibacter flavus TaxID=2576071 RepID=A0A5R8KC82_9BACT|nr:hypothetical protein [Phragmitibacter flavus]TLD69912.1 hypothetical protein FEM03_14350 [Phragmitibacter flavus]
MRLIFLLTILFNALALNLSAQVSTYQPWAHSNDAVAKLWQRISQGQVTLDSSSEKAFLRSLLAALEVPIESQTLVFSKTSLQNNLIHPQRPRALYFNDHLYIGWVQGGVIEIIAIDPGQEPQFYSLDIPVNSRQPPNLAPSEQCFSCHETTRTQRVKGLLVRSVFTADSGQPLLRHGSFLTTPDSPISERWGGWYVTGKHGSELHMGNVTASENPAGDSVHLPRNKGANLESIAHLFDTDPYLTTTSDIVALMVLEHQCAIQNLFTAATRFTLEALERQRAMQDAFGDPISDEPQGSALSLIQHHAQSIVKSLLFADEHPLPEGGIEGNPAFQDAFRKNRKETSDGRSLKDFQLHTRLFKHRCSYMIHSESFLALPPALKQAIYQQLESALDPTPSEGGMHLSASEREHLRNILTETHPEIAKAWKIQTP